MMNKKKNFIQLKLIIGILIVFSSICSIYSLAPMNQGVSPYSVPIFVEKLLRIHFIIDKYPFSEPNPKLDNTIKEIVFLYKNNENARHILKTKFNNNLSAKYLETSTDINVITNYKLWEDILYRLKTELKKNEYKRYNTSLEKTINLNLLISKELKKSPSKTIPDMLSNNYGIIVYSEFADNDKAGKMVPLTFYESEILLLSKGDKVLIESIDGNNYIIELGNFIGSGGNGHVYEIQGTNQVIKFPFFGADFSTIHANKTFKEAKQTISYFIEANKKMDELKILPNHRVKIYEIGKEYSYLIMEKLSGPTLTEWLNNVNLNNLKGLEIKQFNELILFFNQLRGCPSISDFYFNHIMWNSDEKKWKLFDWLYLSNNSDIYIKNYLFDKDFSDSTDEAFYKFIQDNPNTKENIYILINQLNEKLDYSNESDVSA